MHKIGSVATNKRPPRSEPKAEFADLPPCLVQVQRLLHPTGIMWTEISGSTMVYGCSSKSYRGAGMGTRWAGHLGSYKDKNGEQSDE